MVSKKNIEFVVALLVAIFITTVASAADILLVSDADVPGAGGGNNQRDDVFVEFLEDLGHAVDTSGMGAAYHSDQTWWTDGDKAAALEQADLVIVSRRTNSGDYRGGIASQAWNGLETPLLLMSSYITRDTRWGWQVGGNIDGTANTETEMVILNPDSPLVAGIEGEAQVFDWTSPSIGGTENDTPGMWPKNVTGPEINSVIDGADVVGQFDDRAFLIHYPAGTEWSVADDGEGGSQDGAFGADRVFMGHWGYDIQNAAGDPYNFLDFLTPDFLNILSNAIDTLAPPPVTGPACDFDGNDICNVVDIDLLLNNLGGEDLETYDLDNSGVIDLLDRDEWLSITSDISDPPVVYVTGDTDLDGDVDAGDLNNLGGAWQSTDNPGWGDGDFDGNDIVNAGDLNGLGGNWLHGVPAAAAVPEPSALGLLLISLLGLLGLRRR